MVKSNSKFTTKIVPLAIGLIVIAACVVWMVQTMDKGTVIPFSQMEATIKAQNGELVSLKETSDGTLYLKTQDGKFISHVRPNSQMVDKLIETYHISYKYSNGSQAGNWVVGGLILLMAGAAFVLHKKGKIGVTAMKNSTSKETPLPSITLDDVGGLPEEMKEEILQTLEIIKDPDKSAKVGIEAPKGILLYGPPGTGKTLLAQAIAREIGASFFSSSGSAFTELFVGVGASRVRSLFDNARKQKPSVIFIDEVDALAGKRKAHGGEETEKTLTELLVQLDG